MGRIPASMLVLTHNEEANIGACLQSVGWAGEVFVVDSFSTDRTAEIALSMGAKVYSHRFEGYAKQRNWALRSLPFSHDWVLMLDADERIPSALAKEIMHTICSVGNEYAGFYLKYRHVFLGRSLKYGGLYPTWLLRLYRRQLVRFEDRPMNEHVILEGKAGYLSQPFDHRDLRPLSDWIAKHIAYAGLEAEEYLRERFGGGFQDSIQPWLWGKQAERKRWIKLHVWNRLPLLFRPFLLFFRNYILGAGFLDGKAGFIYHVLWSFWYPFLIGARIVERQMAFQAQATNEPLASKTNEKKGSARFARAQG